MMTQLLLFDPNTFGNEFDDVAFDGFAEEDEEEDADWVFEATLAPIEEVVPNPAYL